MNLTSTPPMMVHLLSLHSSLQWTADVQHLSSSHEKCSSRRSGSLITLDYLICPRKTGPVRHRWHSGHARIRQKTRAPDRKLWDQCQIRSERRQLHSSRANTRVRRWIESQIFLLSNKNRTDLLLRHRRVDASGADSSYSNEARAIIPTP